MKRTKVISSVTLMVFAFLALIAAINVANPAANPKWTPLNADQLTFPLLRGGSTSVYTGPSNRSIMFAGDLSDAVALHPRQHDVWVLTNANGMGTTPCPSNPTSTAPCWFNLISEDAPGSPPVRYDPSAVYDAANN